MRETLWRKAFDEVKPTSFTRIFGHGRATVRSGRCPKPAERLHVRDAPDLLSKKSLNLGVPWACAPFDPPSDLRGSQNA